MLCTVIIWPSAYHGTSPAYLDCADYLLEHGQRRFRDPRATSVAELRPRTHGCCGCSRMAGVVSMLDIAIVLSIARRLRPEAAVGRDLALASTGGRQGGSADPQPAGRIGPRRPARSRPRRPTTTYAHSRSQQIVNRE